MDKTSINNIAIDHILSVIAVNRDLSKAGIARYFWLFAKARKTMKRFDLIPPVGGYKSAKHSIKCKVVNMPEDERCDKNLGES